MSAKQLVLDAVRKMPERATIDQILEKLAILAAIRRGEEAADQGKVISHAAMKKRARSWNTK